MAETARTEAADAVVIGGGPGGYVAAIRLGQLGKRSVLVERAQLGGVCLNVGCIPSKALIGVSKLYDRMARGAEVGLLADNLRVDLPRLQAWKDGVVSRLTGGVRRLLDGSRCEVRAGTARLVGTHAVEISAGADGRPVRVEAPAIVLATGSRPVEIPGFAPDGRRILDSTGALALAEVPPRLVVIGAGYIGMEIGTLYAKLGSRVTIVEALPAILPGTDPDLAQVVARRLNKQGVRCLTGARALGWTERGDAAVVTVASSDGEIALEADRVLVAVGRRPNSEGLGLEDVGVRTERGFVVVDRRQETGVPGVYAIGDLTGAPMLAHKASKEAEVAAERIAGRNTEMSVRAMPSVIFSDPEIASVGVSAEAAASGGRPVKIGKFPLAALGRALASHDTDGLVKIVVAEDTGEVLGLHVVAGGAADVIGEAALAIEMGALAGDIGLTVHAHPTLPEALMEAARASQGEAIHIPNR